MPEKQNDIKNSMKDTYSKPDITLKSDNNPIYAGLLSIIPGLGQVYNGDLRKGILILIGTLLGIIFLIGVIIWIYGIYDAYNVAKKMSLGSISQKKSSSRIMVGFFLLFIVVSVFTLFGISLISGYYSTPENTGNAFLDAWKQKDANKAYDLLSAEKKKTSSVNGIHNHMIMGRDILEYKLLNRYESGNITTLIYGITTVTGYRDSLSGIRIPTEGNITLILEGDRWKITSYKGITT